VVRWLAVAALLAGACRFDADYGGTSYRCDDQPICPSGQTCIDGLCRTTPIDAGVDDDPDAGEVPPVLGDLLTYTFEDYEPTDVAHDRSGRRHDGTDRSMRLGAGQYGQGLALSGSPLDIPDSPDLYHPGDMTIDMWIFRDRSGVREALFSDYAAAAAVPDTELSFEIGPTDQLELLLAPDCESNGVVTATSEGTVASTRWTHVAAVWQGDAVQFYIDGDAAGSAPLAGGCQRTARFAVGGRPDGSGTFNGVVDEVKVSSSAKSAELVRASMEFDSQTAPAICGDLLIEGEACDGPGLCCATCRLRENATACNGDLGRCEAGVCLPTDDVTRSDEALIALYNFAEGSGATINDASGNDHHLSIGTPAAVIWGNGTLTVDGDPAIASAELTGALEHCKDLQEVTVEAWVSATSQTREGRVVGVIEAGAIDLSMSQAARAWTSGVRSELALDNGHPLVDTPPDDVTTSLAHLVMTRTSDGWRRLYLDGALRGTNRVGGQLGWAEAVRFVLGADADGSDSWRGTYHLVAIYCRALDELEVARNFAAGAD
jgi:hypothetical protein